MFTKEEKKKDRQSFTRFNTFIKRFRKLSASRQKSFQLQEHFREECALQSVVHNMKPF